MDYKADIRSKAGWRFSATWFARHGDFGFAGIHARLHKGLGDQATV
jgi:hypothetical protein